MEERHQCCVHCKLDLQATLITRVGCDQGQSREAERSPRLCLPPRGMLWHMQLTNGPKASRGRPHRHRRAERGRASATGGAREPETKVNRFKEFEGVVDNGTPANGPLYEHCALTVREPHHHGRSVLSFDPNGTFVLPPSSAPTWFKIVRLKFWGAQTVGKIFPAATPDKLPSELHQ